MIIEYYILNPTGNITALVIDNGIDIKNYNTVCREIMNRHSNVEQVGFVNFRLNNPYLRMTGGEFCGNATMSTAVLYHRLKDNESATVNITVYGSKRDFSVNIIKEDTRYLTSICIDRATDISNYTFEINGRSYCFPVVFMEGISHIIADKSLNKNDAQAIIKKYCDVLKIPAMGIMLYDKKTGDLEPIVYVKSCDTLFFENSCISGSCALSSYLAENNTGKTEISLIQPGGTVRTLSDSNSDKIELFGSVIIENHLFMEIQL